MLFSWVPCYYIQTVEITEGKLGSQKETEILCIYIVYMDLFDTNRRIYFFTWENIKKNWDLNVVIHVQVNVIFACRICWWDALWTQYSKLGLVWIWIAWMGQAEREPNSWRPLMNQMLWFIGDMLIHFGSWKGFPISGPKPRSRRTSKSLMISCTILLAPREVF